MRQVSTVVSTIINNDSTIRFYVATELEFPTGTIRTTSLPYDITVSGVGTFTSDVGMVEYEPPRVSTTVDKQTYRLSFTDHADEFHDLFKQGVRGAKVSLFLGFFDSSGNPITTPDDLLLFYSGFIDRYSINNDWTKKVAIIECASPMADLDLVGAYPASKDGWNQYSVTDTAFDDVYENGKGIDLKWGKK